MSPPALLRPDPDPRHLAARPWGGTRLRGPQSPEERYGEAWIFSTLDHHPSYVDGRPLLDVLGGPLPYLVKVLDTAAPLSVQVHPDDDDLGPGTLGKEEAWVVLEAGPGAWIRAGLASGTTAADLLDAVRGAPRSPQGHASVLHRLARHRPEPGDVILLPAGAAHALGPGLLLVEIQQPADATLRLYDYGRGRPLHLEEAARVLRGKARPRILPAGRAGRVHGKHLVVARHHGPLVVSQPETPLLVVAGRAPARFDPVGEPSTVAVEPNTPVLVAGAGRLVPAEGGWVVVAGPAGSTPTGGPRHGPPAPSDMLPS